MGIHAFYGLSLDFEAIFLLRLMLEKLAFLVVVALGLCIFYIVLSAFVCEDYVKR